MLSLATDTGDSPEREEDQAAQQWRAVIASLSAEANRRVLARKPVEDRWLEDLRQYHGQYESVTESRMQAEKRSRIFMNRTMPKTNALAARLEDMLFPTDDRNWGLQPTPEPELTSASEAAADALIDAQQQMTLASEQGAPPEEMAARSVKVREAATLSEQLRLHMDEARRRCTMMERRIEDHLVESRYQAECRDVIMDACKIGVGVLKGPMLEHDRHGRWEKAGDGVFALSQPRARPRARRVDPWSFFPDPDARSVGEGRGVYERYLVTPPELRRWARRGFDADAIRRLLQTEPQPGSVPPYLTDLRAVTGDTTSGRAPGYYTIWCYSGPIEPDDLATVYQKAADESGLADVTAQIETDDLADMQVVLWFCGDEVLKVGPHPLDSGDALYSVYSIMPDEASALGGAGIPRRMRNEQAALNAAWRKLLDNAAVAGHQILVDEAAIEPENGEWHIVGDKLWRAKSGTMSANAMPFRAIPIPPNLEHMAAIIELCERQIDAVTSMPLISQGEQGTGVTKTATGMSLLASSANVEFRRLVKMFDDDVTAPVLRRFYDWEMQSPETPDDYKGDYAVEARGAGVLLVREVEAANSLVFLAQFARDPVFMPLFRIPQALRLAIRAHSLQADEIIKSDEEIDQQAAAAAENPESNLAAQELALREQEMSLKAAMAEQEAAARVEVAQIAQDTQMMIMAERYNMTVEQLRAKLEMNRAQIDARERSLAAEIGMAERTGQHAGGAV